MSNLTATNCDVGAVATRIGCIQPETLSFSGADTFVKGTIMARKTAASVSAGTVQGGTGTGTISNVAIADGPVVPKAGVYVLTCITAVANGGIFKLVDPDGGLVAGYLPMTAGSGGATNMEAGGLSWTLTDATDFIAGNYFEITVVAGSKIVPFAVAGTGGAQRPIGVLLDDYTKSGAGDLPCMLLVEGEVVRERLIIDADGDGDDITAAQLDDLRRAGVSAVSVKQLGSYDNA